MEWGRSRGGGTERGVMGNGGSGQAVASALTAHT